jgi:lipopolysaccharide/colanic/teichoic acid biosynthesis glycosyltransferase
VSQVSAVKAAVAGATKNFGFTHAAGQQEIELVQQDEFRRMLSRERKRSERSGKHLLLMLVDGKAVAGNSDPIDFQRITQALLPTIRDTDIAGWFEGGAIIGIIFTELGKTDMNLAVKAIENKVMRELQVALKPALLNRLFVSFFAYPDHWGGKKSARPLDPALYPDLLEVEQKKRVSLVIKRSMDVVGSAMALVALSPLFLILAIVIKLTSKGPVFFRQQRIGQYGVPFVFLKFRSMFVSTDAKIHEEYVKNFIAGKVGSARRDGNEKLVFKITNDPRVTWIGRFMRRTSLDEIPQFWNVLKGQMSLVGPRPPIAYELEAYDVWHRRRLLEAKPGITGLWQVHGRSTTTFDEMVRLDLQYSRTWSPLLDLKILLQTPRAVVSGDGAY